ncbi:hypothetical protein I302_104709 [Kwoniella bestiolae CBS 10118]|uniref:Uncharacterized protein n=1 Tax=Kwoniella bestiolae CBS 10118 TaxID=1296100 RepID=A0A1B9FS01_9TREE|nr:hypothetical protein I302_09220 [Kwoniella bestiolae CBS 10118]OCF21541.1 hypothetical protein I302_09220 [Kwoniella bestiolae CBS 10118]
MSALPTPSPSSVVSFCSSQTSSRQSKVLSPPSTFASSSSRQVNRPRSLSDLTQSLPDDLKAHILDIISKSFEDLKTLTRVSQDFYSRYAPILYKNLHIKTYEVPIKMRLMNPKYRKGYHPFTKEEESLYHKYRERRLGVTKLCETLRFTKENDVRSTLGLVCEFTAYSQRSAQDSDLDSTSRLFRNVKYLIIEGRCSLMDKTICYKDNRKMISSSKLWKNLNPTHICIDSPDMIVQRIAIGWEPGASVLTRCGYLDPKHKWINTGSVTFHNTHRSVVKHDENVEQRFFLREGPGHPHKLVLNEHDLSFLNFDSNNNTNPNSSSTTITHTANNNRNRYKKIELLNWKGQDVLFDHADNPIGPVEGLVEVYTPDDGDACICCGKR